MSLWSCERLVAFFSNWNVRYASSDTHKARALGGTARVFCVSVDKIISPCGKELCGARRTLKM